jgi:hypothetical protein
MNVEARATLFTCFLYMVAMFALLVYYFIKKAIRVDGFFVLYFCYVYLFTTDIICE